MKTERKFLFTLVLENYEFDLFKHIWVEAVNLDLLGLDDPNVGTLTHRTELKKKHKEFYEKITKELI